jgi:hypothetical protein
LLGEIQIAGDLFIGPTLCHHGKELLLSACETEFCSGAIAGDPPLLVRKTPKEAQCKGCNLAGRTDGLSDRNYPIH